MSNPSGFSSISLDMFVRKWQANQQLLIGDVVTVPQGLGHFRLIKSLVAPDYVGAVGVVVGGKNTNNFVTQDDGMIGKVACVALEDVMVAWAGFVKVVADANISIRDRLTAATAGTAGRVKLAVAAATNFPLGTALNDATAGQIVNMFLDISKTQAP